MASSSTYADATNGHRHAFKSNRQLQASHLLYATKVVMMTVMARVVVPMVTVLAQRTELAQYGRCRRRRGVQRSRRQGRRPTRALTRRPTKAATRRPTKVPTRRPEKSSIVFQRWRGLGAQRCRQRCVQRRRRRGVQSSRQPCAQRRRRRSVRCSCQPLSNIGADDTSNCEERSIPLCAARP